MEVVDICYCGMKKSIMSVELVALFVYLPIVKELKMLLLSYIFFILLHNNLVTLKIISRSYNFFTKKKNKNHSAFMSSCLSINFYFFYLQRKKTLYLIKKKLNKTAQVLYIHTFYIFLHQLS